MSLLRIFILALLVAPAVPATPALAAPLMPSQAPTMEDVDPGIDHTGRDRDLPSEFRKQSVYYRTEQPPGTIIVNTADRHLYLIMGNGVAMRYGVGVGRDGLPDSRYQCARDYRTGGVVRLLPAGQRRCRRSLLARADRDQGPGAASIALPKIC